MERLTDKNFMIGFEDSSKLPSYVAIYEKLRKYEDLEEQGKLLKAPCAVGDMVYEIFPGDLENNISEERVIAFSTNAMMISRFRSLIPFNEIGKKNIFNKRGG